MSEKEGGKLKKGIKFEFDTKEQEAWVLPLSLVIQKNKRSMNKRRKRVRELEDDDNMTITELIKSVKKCDDDVEKSVKGERSGIEVDNNVLDHETVAEQEEEDDERVKQRKLVQDFPVWVTEGEAWVLPLSQVIPKGKRSMNKRYKRARELEDDDNMTITELIKSVKKCSDSDDVENGKGEGSGHEVCNDVSDHETVAEQEEEDDERVKQRKLAQDFPVLVTEGEAWVLPLSQVIPKGKRWMNKRCKRAHEDDENAKREDDDGNMTIAEMIESKKKCSDDVEKNDKGERCGLEVDNSVSDNAKGERSKLEVENNVSDLPQKLAFGDETVETQDIEQKNDENKTSKPSNGVAEQQEDDVVVDETVETQEIEQKHDENKTSKPSNGIAEQQEEDVVVDETVAIQEVEQKHDENKTSKRVAEQQEDDVVVDETVATQEIEQKHDENKTSKPSNGIAEQQKDDVVVENDENNSCNGVAEQQEDAAAVDERLKQRKLVIWELASKLEERILKVENTLAKIKQWKLGQN